MNVKRTYGLTTAILHSDREKPIEHGALHKPIHAGVAFGYRDARDLAQVFQGKQAGFRYGRQGNPTVGALEDKINTLEQGAGTVCFATGMAAIAAVATALLRRGDHVVASAYLFGNTHSLWESMAGKGIDVDFVDTTRASAVEQALRPATRLVFTETIANPRTQVADLARIGALCNERGILYAVDNTMTSACLFQPRNAGAGLVVNSLTKYYAGHGNALGGSVTDTGLFDWRGFPNLGEPSKNGPASGWGLAQLRAKGLRDFGAALGPEAAHHIAVGMETIALRIARQCANARALASMLAADPRVKAVYYPGLATHSQHALAAQLFADFGALLSFELDEGIDCFDYINRLRLGVAASNLGDTRTLVIPVAHTIFYEVGAQRRAAMGIAEGLIRVSVGIEDTSDLVNDFQAALAD
ncbi:cystathionine gamma-synthase family protein [Noviherbaspirillum denitrificans]|uniref:Cystathionine gamma-synthase n=1 Tax=Noviherbaspirillum denitrificans TaxID=1968433 RepID=A0A254TET8_9BURK|nr:cystathionine gamma-synthase family protein [Noviherbaspirillum denitrificans]OWW21179.1 hypothetical protein AYR66_18565 [Noviherbaspirillum denitrificans]